MMPGHSLNISAQEIYLMIHGIAILLSYAAFFVASAAAALYIIQNSALKTKRPGIIFSRMPGLSILDKLNYRSIGIGLPILTISIFSAFLWAKSVHGTYWWGMNSRHLSSIVLWLVYAVTLHVRLSAKMRGRKVAILSIIAFIVMVFSLFGSCP